VPEIREKQGQSFLPLHPAYSARPMHLNEWFRTFAYGCWKIKAVKAEFMRLAVQSKL
jgi:hypothetical protein